MAFTNAWVETDPDGAVIFVSALDDSDRLIKNALRERLEGDPAVPDLTGLIEVGSWSVAPKPRKGAARVYVDTQANILAFGATKREDGRLAVASDTGRLFHVATAAVAAIKLDAGDLGQGNIPYSRLPTGGGVWANGGNLSITGGTTTVAGLINTGDELFTTAASRIIPGVTSLSLRNATNLADNLIITDAGLATFRNTVTVSAGGITVTGASTITGTLGGVTILTVNTVTATTLTGTLSTAAQPNVTSLGTLTALTISGTLTLTAATSKIVPGATSLSLRNTADSADNILITDAGAVTIRGDLTASARLVFSTAVSKIVPGATSISLRNNADNADNLIITDAGVITVRGNILPAVTNTVSLGSATLGFASITVITGPNAIIFRSAAGAIHSVLGGGLNAMTIYDSGGINMAGFDKGVGAETLGLAVWDQTGATAKRVERGGVDSGGAGFRLMRIAN